VAGNKGLVGESGSGKTTIGRAILRALEPTEGSIQFHTNGDTLNLERLKGKQLAQFRSYMQLIFQDPMPPLTPA
jgi:ABC-type oligopeptide transport system ATPase subunit